MNVVCAHACMRACVQACGCVHALCACRTCVVRVVYWRSGVVCMCVAVWCACVMRVVCMCVAVWCMMREWCGA